MSAVVCGKRSFFEELANSPPVSKRSRCSSSPVRFSPTKSLPSPFQIDQLLAMFPDVDKQLIERTLEEYGDDLDSAIKSLHELRLGSAGKNVNSGADQSGTAQEANAQVEHQATANEEVSSMVDHSAAANMLNMDGAEWVELFVREMMTAADVNDAKARAARALEVFEKSIRVRAGAEAAQTLHQENAMLKQQMEVLIQENAVLKRAVVAQQKRHKEFEDQSQELGHLKQLLTQYQEQIRTLEVNNYALTLHLKQAQQNSSIPGRFHPDVF